MNRRSLTIIALAAWLAAACSDIVEPFYAESYEIARVAAAVELTARTPEQTESAGAEPEDSESSADLERLKAEIEASVLDEAPVAAGGGYRIEYTGAFGGPLTVCPAEGAPALSGTFAESTTRNMLVFRYAGRTDSCLLSTYDEEGEARRILFQTDLTERYRASYPEAEIVSVVREEYTLRRAD